jgi:cytidylate kinase
VSRSIQKLVEEQVGRWRQGQGPEAEVGACVAVSHLPGAGGAEFGRSIAERLGYGFFDREIVEAIVKDAGTQEQLVADLDEHVRGLVERYVIDTVRARAFAEGDYLKSVVRVVGTLARRGRAVLLGRGSAVILAPNEALRVLVVAPREVRLERIARERGLASAAAGEYLEREEASRAEFFRHHFGVRQDDPALYDLSINTGSLSTALATDLVVQALAGQFPRRVAAGERRVAGP